jgi:isopenicillin N synthase-like dioxygenase
MKTITGIPQVDLSKYVNGDATLKAEFIQELGNAFSEIGFVSVINHGIPIDLVNRFFKLSEQFFAQNVDLKAKYEVKGGAGQRGYTSFGREHAKQSNVGDLKEFFQFGQELPAGHELKNEYPDNIYVDEMPEYKQVARDLYVSFEKSGSYLLKAIAIYLNLPENYFERHIEGGNSILRAIHYPPITAEPKSAIRAEEHEDINLITLLFGASADGLQVRPIGHDWVDVKALGDSIVINVGDMLQRLTNNLLKSTTHRVVNPPREMWHTARISIPFFLHPRSDMDLTCLENCISSENPVHYEPISAGEYLDERLREIGLKK